MSFILDALKKSENERAQSTPAEFAAIPSSPDTPAVPRWLWIFAALLLVNAVVLVGVLLRPETTIPTPTVSDVPLAAATPPASQTPTDFSARIDEARRNQPDRPPPAAADSAEQVTAVLPAQQEPVRAEQASSSNATRDASPAMDANSVALLPSLVELQLEGRMQLPPLHIDIHVYSEQANDRFVFINMSKYRENDRLSEGPVVREITREGVVLSHQGTAFVLPRE